MATDLSWPERFGRVAGQAGSCWMVHMCLKLRDHVQHIHHAGIAWAVHMDRLQRMAAHHAWHYTAHLLKHMRHAAAPQNACNLQT